MTYEFARWVRPAATVIINLGVRGRGAAHPERYGRLGLDNVWVNDGYNDDIPAELVRDFLELVDVVYMAETSYYEPFCDVAREMGVPTVLHAMPELWRAEMAQPDEIWLPTSWEASRVPAARLVPVPVPTDTFAPAVDWLAAARRQVLFHLQAPAFHDRNGTELVQQAMAETCRPARIVFGGGTRQPAQVANYRGGRIDVGWCPGGTVERRAAYPDECGVLLLPRRYAGLSLPMQEAAALGWPIISLDLEPQRQWLHPELLVAATVRDRVKMAGGWFDVHACDPIALARTIDRLDDPKLWRAAREYGLDHAAGLSWERWAPWYRDLLGEVVAGT